MSCVGLGSEVLGQRQEQLTQSLIVSLWNTHFILVFQKLENYPIYDFNLHVLVPIIHFGRHWKGWQFFRDSYRGLYCICRGWLLGCCSINRIFMVTEVRFDVGFIAKVQEIILKRSRIEQTTISLVIRQHIFKEKEQRPNYIKMDTRKFARSCVLRSLKITSDFLWRSFDLSLMYSCTTLKNVKNTKLTTGKVFALPRYNELHQDNSNDIP